MTPSASASFSSAPIVPLSPAESADQPTTVDIFDACRFAPAPVDTAPPSDEPTVTLPPDLARRARGFVLELDAAREGLEATTGRRIYEMRVAWGSDYSPELDAAAAEMIAGKNAAIAAVADAVACEIAAIYALADWRIRAEAAAVADGGPGMVDAATQYNAHLTAPHSPATLTVICHRWGRRLRRWVLRHDAALAAELTGDLARAMGHTPAIVRAQARGELRSAGIYQPTHRRSRFAS